MSEHLFYDKHIFRDREQRLIERILEKYKKEPPTEELKQKIWDELQHEKHLGNISIPFKVVMRKDPSGKYPDFIEVILDTRV